MKDSLLFRKKIKPKKFIKSKPKPKVEAPKKPRITLKGKIQNFKLRIKKQESGSKGKKLIRKRPLLLTSCVLLLRRKFQSSPKPRSTAGIFSLLKRFEFDLQLLLIPSILLIILAILLHINKNLAAKINANNLSSYPQTAALAPYPLVTTDQVPDLSAKAAIVLDVASQVPVFTKNPDLRFSTASTTKIMTSLVALDYYKPDAILTIKSSGVQGTILGAVPGQQFTFLNLLYAMLLPSNNDAAVAISDNYPGGQSAFVAAMNTKAQTLHLTNTHFSDPDGLDDDGDYTTVVDMSRLASAAITNQLFTQVTSTKEKFITDRSGLHTYKLDNSNELLGIDGVTGMKTGTTEGAGEVLVTSAIENKHKYIIVVMDSQDRFGDTEKLIDFVKNNVHYIE